MLGARTNTEGKESTGAAALTGRIPYWGYHIPENRRGTHLVEVDVEVDDIMDWGCSATGSAKSCRTKSRY